METNAFNLTHSGSRTETERSESVVTTWALVGATLGLVVALFLTLRSFALEGLGDGLLWFFVFGPVLVAVAYWTSMVGAWVVWRVFHRHR